MKINIGMVDRAVRIIAGIALLCLVFAGPRTPWGLVGLVPLLTGLIRWCPAYSLLDFITRKGEK